MKMDKITRKQISGLSVRKGRPLAVLDADEVLVHFALPFAQYLHGEGLSLKLTEYSLENAVLDPEGRILPLSKVDELLDRFVADHTDVQPVIDGAVRGVQTLGEVADVLVLSNVPHAQHAARVKNLQRIGINVPVLSNTGPKGLALATLREMADAPVLFVDDSPEQIASAAQVVPEITRIHFTGCDMVRGVLPISEHAHHAPSHWDDVARIALDILAVNRH